MEIQSNIILNKKEILNTVLTNIILLFERRKYINNNFNVNDNLLKEFLDNKVVYFEENSMKLSVIYIDSDIKNISTGTMIDDYLNKNNEYKKFILCKSFSKKVYKQIEEIYKTAEIFHIYEFLEDIPSKKIIPQHEILVGTDRDLLLNTYKLNELSSIYKTDMMSRYYGAKVNDIFRIKRYNLNSGISVVYRRVVEGNLDILF